MYRNTVLVYEFINQSIMSGSIYLTPVKYAVFCLALEKMQE